VIDWSPPSSHWSPPLDFRCSRYSVLTYILFQQDPHPSTQAFGDEAETLADELTLSTLLSKNKRKTTYRGLDNEHESEPLRNKRKIDEAQRMSNEQRSTLLDRQREAANRHIMASGGAANSSGQGQDGPEMIHSAGRGLLNLSRAPGHPSMHGTMNNPLLQHMGTPAAPPGFDCLSMLSRDLFLAQNLRNAQAQGSAFLGGNFQGGTSGSAEGLFNADLAAAAYLNRNQGIARDLASGRLMPSASSYLHDQLDNATATSELLRSRLSSLSSTGGNAGGNSLFLGGHGAGAGSSSMAADHFLQRETNALLAGAGTDPALLRRAAELGLCGFPAAAGAGLPPMLSSRLFGGGDPTASILMSSLFQAGGYPDSSVFGGAFGGAPSGLHAAAALGLRDPSSGRHVPPSPGAAHRFAVGGSQECTYDEQTYSSKSKTNRANASLPIVFPKRKLTAEEMAGIPPLPSCQECPLPHFTQRTCVPLATDEDENWLSEFLCFIRSELVEVFRASNDDVASRINSKKVVYGQVGIRCRYCAHMAHNDRASRSSSFPSSIDRIYQSLTMMIRDHFVRCPGLPEALKARFLELKSRTTQGATDSKRYWIESAKKLGMIDTPNQGILVNQATQAAAIASLGSPIHPRANSAESLISERQRPQFMIVLNDDKPLVSEYIYFLMTQVEKVYLTESERVGNRKSMELGMPGFGCKHCCASDRKGLCRFFPARRRTLPAKIKDLSDHLRRCTMCPMDVKEKLVEFKRKKLDMEPTEESNKHFFDRVWARLHTAERPDPRSDVDN
jgi:hypothetical protein